MGQDGGGGVTGGRATLAGSFSVAGAGLHTGRVASVTLAPAAPGTGLRFRVVARRREVEVAATWRFRVPGRMNTALDLGDGRKLRTIEHVMAALAAAGVDDAVIRVRGEEIPILDGSAARWSEGIAAAGLTRADAPRRAIRITAPFQVSALHGFLRAEPHEGFAVDVTTDRLPGFGVLRWAGEVTPEVFRTEIARSRSFGMPSVLWRGFLRGPAASRVLPRAMRDALWRRSFREQSAEGDGPAPNAPDPRSERPVTEPSLRRMAVTGPEPTLRGAWPGRVTLVLGGRVLGGARYTDEPVRHKVLDLVGDLALAGMPFIGRFVANAPTHDLTFALVSELLRGREGWEMVTLPA